VQADALYNEAVSLENKAGNLMLIKDDSMLRLALDKYNQLIKDYPTSDKIDDAAFHAAGIYEHFSDYTIAALYYQRVYEWDPGTSYPAKFKAAYVLDTYLHRRSEALELYKQAVASIQRAGQHPQWRQFAENRIAQLTKTAETLE
jgi:tetratricopeptide (TPR) repeat protein